MFGVLRSKHSTGTGPSSSKESLDSLGTRSSSNENLDNPRDLLFEPANSLHKVTPFEVHFLGQIQDVNLGGKHHRDPDVLLMDKLEEGQLEGKISMVPKDEDLVSLTVSKYGIKVTDLKQTEVLQRHPLHTVAQVVCYADSFYKSNVAFKIGQVGRTVFDCFVFQCHHESQAQDICQAVKREFEIVSSR